MKEVIIPKSFDLVELPLSLLKREQRKKGLYAERHIMCSKYSVRMLCEYAALVYGNGVVVTALHCPIQNKDILMIDEWIVKLVATLLLFLWNFYCHCH